MLRHTVPANRGVISYYTFLLLKLAEALDLSLILIRDDFDLDFYHVELPCGKEPYPFNF